jgi:hypothetical protein
MYGGSNCTARSLLNRKGSPVLLSQIRRESADKGHSVAFGWLVDWLLSVGWILRKRQVTRRRWFDAVWMCSSSSHGVGVLLLLNFLAFSEAPQLRMSSKFWTDHA